VFGAVAVGAILTGAGVWTYQHGKADPTLSQTSPLAKVSSVDTPREKPKPVEPDRLDLFGAPLPDHAVARMGMVRLRHAGQLNSVAYPPDAKTVASASWEKTIRIWDAATGQELRKLQGHDDKVMAVAFAPDGKTLASASVDKTVRLWGAATGQQLRILNRH